MGGAGGHTPRVLRNVLALAAAFFLVILLPLGPALQAGARWSTNGVLAFTSGFSQGGSPPGVINDGSGAMIVTWSDSRSGNPDIYVEHLNTAGSYTWTVRGKALCTATGTQAKPVIVSDTTGGAIVAWEDERSGNTDIYARRVDQLGNALWTADGVPICTAAGGQTRPKIVVDCSGGAIIAWEDMRFGYHEVFAQRIDPSGVVQWPANGVDVCTSGISEQMEPEMVSDGVGGAIVTWFDYDSDSAREIRAQRLDSGGTLQWAGVGVLICNVQGWNYPEEITSDGSNGAVITWVDDRTSYGDDVYAQRVDSAGVPQWTANGVAVCTASGAAQNVRISADGSGGSLIAWQDSRSGSNDDIYTQKLNGPGAAQWTANGVAVCTASGDQISPDIASDGSGGAILAWGDCRARATGEIYSQRISSAGSPQWTANGVGVCTADPCVSPMLAPDGAGGVLLTWNRYLSGYMSSAEVFAQDLSAAGAAAWVSNGVCVAGSFEQSPDIVEDGSGGAFIACQTWRSTLDWDIQAQRVDSGGVLRFTEGGVSLCIDGSSQMSPVIASDGSGGIVAAWEDDRNMPTTDYDIYAQRLDSAGSRQWGDSGVQVSTSAFTDQQPRIITDGSGGAIVTWVENDIGIFTVRAQRLDSSGTPQWGAGGKALAGSITVNPAPRITGNFSGGAIVSWTDSRGGTPDIYAKGIDSSGAYWAAGDVAVCSAGDVQEDSDIAPDGSGGAVIAWEDDYRAGDAESDIYAQRLDWTGAPQWTAQGVPVRVTGGDALRPVLSSTEEGTNVAWCDGRSGNWDVYAQKLDGLGSIQWTANGVGACTAAGDQTDPKLCNDGYSGAVITWQDNRNGNWDIYTQRITSSGTVAWAANGVATCSAAGNQTLPCIAPDSTPGGVIAWQDYRYVNSTEVFAQKMSNPAPTITSITPNKGDNNGTVSITNLAGSGFAGSPTVKLSRDGQADITATNVNVVSPGKITCKFNLAGKAVGKWDLGVRNQDGQGGTLDNGFTVEYPAPTVTSITPVAATNDGTAYITNLAGTGFRNGATVSLKRAGCEDVTGDYVTVVSSSKITCNFDLRGVVSGKWDVYVGNSDGKSGTRKGAFTVNSVETPTWYLAEGTTAWGFETYISIENPNEVPVSAGVTYMTDRGEVEGPVVDLPAMSQATVNPRDTLGEKDFSTKVTCVQGSTIAVDRTMSWTGPGAPSPEAHSSIGVTAPAKVWYLPEGSSQWGFETWLLIQNPDESQAECTVTYMVEGGYPVTVTKVVPSNSRASYNIADDIGGKDASIKVESNVPVIPERSMYRNNRREGHDSIGTTTVSHDYYLAEGTTGWGFTTYVLVQNPNITDTQVTVTYMTSGGAVPQQPFTMPGNSRRTIRVNDVLIDKDFSTLVNGSQPIIAERAMYWDAGQGEACHDSIGMAEPHRLFYLPDGQASDGRETWTLVQNPNDADVKVRVSYLPAGGGGAVTFEGDIPANSRVTYNMADRGISGRAAVMVECLTSGKKIMCERAMYWNSRGAGTDTIGGYSD